MPRPVSPCWPSRTVTETNLPAKADFLSRRRFLGRRREFFGLSRLCADLRGLGSLRLGGRAGSSLLRAGDDCLHALEKLRQVHLFAKARKVRLDLLKLEIHLLAGVEDQ